MVNSGETKISSSSSREQQTAKREVDVCRRRVVLNHSIIVFKTIKSEQWSMENYGAFQSMVFSMQVRTFQRLYLTWVNTRLID